MRKSGILMPISSLPSPYGIGTMGKSAFLFIDFLKKAGQSCWQILPIGQTGYGDSPYQSFSSYAGNPYFIDLDLLAEDNLLLKDEYINLFWGNDAENIDYGNMYNVRYDVLKKACSRLVERNDSDYRNFCDENSFWLDNYALYMALKAENNDIPWNEWNIDIRLREKIALEEAEIRLAKEIEFRKAMQYLFFSQWKNLKAYANKNGISIIGDLPIYVSADSADVWANREQFQLDEEGIPTNVAGCPPDAFCVDGQLWGNPLFDWEKMKKDNYRWWIERIKFQFNLFDTLRIDHFRGFDEYYSIPYGEKTARNGKWCKGVGIDFFKALNEAIGEKDIIAEDLGFITESVRQLLKATGYPGMKILEFAFDENMEDSEYLPHCYDKNTIVYTGTHDNETILGWYEHINSKAKKYCNEYLRLDEKEGINWGVMRGAWASPAKLAIMQMQDILGLDSRARMNTPSTLGENWKWRMRENSLTDELAEKVCYYTGLYQRLGSQNNYRRKIMKINEFKEKLSVLIEEKYHCDLNKADAKQIYYALLEMTQEINKKRPTISSERKLYYFSAEFLIGKLLSNNLLALGLYETADSVLRELGFNLSEIEEYEPEPSLGNGGLGRLAACFLDSISALKLNGDGVGLNYHYGLFRQDIKSGYQNELANPWIENESWLIKTDTEFKVQFGGFDLKAKMMDIAIPGAYSETSNRLHLFDVEEPSLPPEEGINFDKNDIAHQLTSFLYPDDSDESGQLLRVYQQYFMVSAGAQLILKELKEKGCSLHELSKYAVIQINDTHPSMIIPEMIRLLLEEGLSMDEAVAELRKTCAYTNHTILAEALEKWPMKFIEKVAPQLIPIIKELDKRIKNEYNDEKLYIIDKNDCVHMAHMDIHYSYSVNGVAQLHTDILKNSELHAFNEIYPDKFNNKTNGITFRRWLEVCNPKLTTLIDEYIGISWRKNTEELQKLLEYKDDDKLLDSLLEVKTECKTKLAERIFREQGIKIDENSIFDIQIKRFHEYKRQQMNALFVIYEYLEIKAGNYPEKPITVIFGGKAAPAYIMAKNIIHLIISLKKLIEKDNEVNKWLKVIMVENYNVSYAQDLIPACDISEQISLASKEASGTGNMKFMLNGAVTLGTMDGANVEIAELVGKDNIFTFGATSEYVIDLYKKGTYLAKNYYHNPKIEKSVDFILSPELLSIGNSDMLAPLWYDLKYKDWFMALLDLEEYIETKTKIIHAYCDRKNWAKKMLVNIAKAGFFSSDRTIAEYNKDIWHID